MKTQQINSQPPQQTTDFPNLNPIQKARMLSAGKLQGQSNRDLAKSFEIGESTVRAFLSLLLLPVADQAAIESGSPYRPYLERVAEIKAETRRTDIATVRLQERAAQKGVGVIRRVFREQRFTPPYAEQILRDVQAYIRGGELEGVLKASDVNWVDDVDAILAATKPRGLEEVHDMDFFFGITKWLCNALVRLMPNSDVRERAIYLALGSPQLLCG